MNAYLNKLNWQASGDKLRVKEFITLLIENGVKPFDGRKTTNFLIKQRAIIKGIDYNRKHEEGYFFISSDEYDRERITFDLDKADLNDLIKWILNK
jgi:hypothetical protein